LQLNGWAFSASQQNGDYSAQTSKKDRLINQWYIPPALLVWLVLLVVAAKMPLEEAALVAGTKQNLSNLLFFRCLCYAGIGVR